MSIYYKKLYEIKNIVITKYTIHYFKIHILIIEVNLKKDNQLVCWLKFTNYLKLKKYTMQVLILHKIKNLWHRGYTLF